MWRDSFDLVSRIFLHLNTRTTTLFPRSLHDPAVALLPAREAMSSRELITPAPSRCGPGLLALEIGLDQSEGLLSALPEKNYRDIYQKTIIQV